jgi:CheY-like chemotaxis protein
LPGANAAVPIIALTANAFADDKRKCEAAGMNAHLAKPFRREDLITAIATVLKLKGNASRQFSSRATGDEISAA